MWFLFATFCVGFPRKSAEKITSSWSKFPPPVHLPQPFCLYYVSHCASSLIRVILSCNSLHLFQSTQHLSCTLLHPHQPVPDHPLILLVLFQPALHLSHKLCAPPTCAVLLTSHTPPIYKVPIAYPFAPSRTFHMSMLSLSHTLLLPPLYTPVSAHLAIIIYLPADLELATTCQFPHCLWLWEASRKLLHQRTLGFS